jgi:energy-coupling factor transport system substrate-specific component
MSKLVTKKRYLSTADLLTMAAVAVVGGILDSYLWPLLMNVATPVFAFLGPIGWIAASGVYMIMPSIIALLIRRPGAVTLYGIVQGFVEMLFGNAFGPMAIVYSGLEAVGLDLGMAIFRYRGGLVAVMIGAGIGSVFIDEAYIFLFHLQTTYTLIVGGISAFVSGAVLGGLIGWFIVRALGRTGVVSRVGLSGYEELK